MLLELRVENLLLIERAELRLGAGLERAHGRDRRGQDRARARARPAARRARARPGSCGPGAAEAYVEGVFELPGRAARARSASACPTDAEELVLARRVSAEGRTRAYLGGRSATRGRPARRSAAALLAFYGQHEHRKLTLASAQLEILDGFCGPEQARAPRGYARRPRARARAARPRSTTLRERAGARERELDLLEFELAEIEAAAPERGGGGRAARRARAPAPPRGAARRGARRGAEALAPDGERRDAGVAALLAAAARRSSALDGVDRGARRARRAVRARCALEADDLAAELRRYGEAVEAAPGRLEEVEERLDALDRLKRKHGGTIAAVLEHAERCRARRDELAGAEVALEDASARLAAARSRAATRWPASCARRPRGRPRRGWPRRSASGSRSWRWRARASRSRWRRATSPRPDRRRRRSSSASRPTPACRPAPLREIASGGELSRVMLALTGVAADGGGGDGPELLVFDEVDAGHRRPDRARGRRALRALGERPPGPLHHPPAADRRRWPPATSRSRRTRRRGRPAPTVAPAAQRDEVVGELVRMLGADDADLAARRHARELLAGGVDRPHRTRSCSRPLRVAPVAGCAVDCVRGRLQDETSPCRAGDPAAGGPRDRPARASGRSTSSSACDRGDVAIIDHLDLDRVSAEDLIAVRGRGGGQLPRRRRSGRYPNMGPLLLVQAGILLVDAPGAPLFAELRGRRHDRDPRRRDPPQRRGRRPRRGAGPGDRPGAQRPAPPRRSARRSRRSRTTRSSTWSQERELLSGKLELPHFDDRLPRPARASSSCAASTTSATSRRCGRTSATSSPVLVGVDGGADAIIEEGFKPRHDRRRHGLGDRGRRCAAAPSSSSTPTPTAARPGREHLEALGLPYKLVPGAGHQPGRRDADRRREGRALIVSVGSHFNLVEFLDKNRRGHVLDVPHAPADRRDPRRRQGREPPLPAAAGRRAAAAGAGRRAW